jgi:type II secretory pathway component PulF
MPSYAYKALQSGGQSTSGSLQAANRSAALEQLSRQSLVPVEVEESHVVRIPKAPARTVGRVSQVSVDSSIHELSNLLSGGVALSRALRIISREASTAAARRQWTAVADEVVNGSSLADAMGKWSGSFAGVQVAMVRAGEMGGFLDVVLGQIADFRGRERDLKGRMKAALVYPVVLAVLSSAVLVFLLTYFIPRFSSLFAEFGASLPALTRGIIAASQGISRYGVLILVAVVGLGVAAQGALRTQSGRRHLERAMLATPALGTVLARFALVRFCRMLGTLLGAGVSLVTALVVAREAIGNQTLTDAVSSSIQEVQRGTSLARSLAACPVLFPGSVVEVIAVAEESGRLDQELIRLAVANEGELDRRLRMLVTLAEPALLFLMAAVVGTIVIGMLLPVFTLQDYIH